MFSLGTAFFSYFFLVVKVAFGWSQAVFFSHGKAHLRPQLWLLFIRDSYKTWQDSGNWSAQKFSKKTFFRNIPKCVESALYNVIWGIQDTMFSLTPWLFCKWTCIFTQVPFSHNPFFSKTLWACDKILPHAWIVFMLWFQFGNLFLVSHFSHVISRSSHVFSFIRHTKTFMVRTMTYIDGLFFDVDMS
jgi:hypothetical protein